MKSSNKIIYNYLGNYEPTSKHVTLAVCGSPTVREKPYLSTGNYKCLKNSPKTCSIPRDVFHHYQGNSPLKKNLAVKPYRYLFRIVFATVWSANSLKFYVIFVYLICYFFFVYSTRLRPCMILLYVTQFFYYIFTLVHSVLK